MVRLWFAISICACGRIDFDPLAAGSLDARSDVDAAPPCTFGAFDTPQTDSTLNSAATDWGPTLSHDQLTLTFASERGGANDRIFQSTRPSVGAPWSTPAELTTIAPGTDVGDPSLSIDGLSLYWGGPEVSLATRPTIGGAWTDMGSIVHGTADHSVDGGPDISPDQLTLVFTGTKTSDALWHMYEVDRASTTDAWGAAFEVPGIDSAIGEAYGSYRGDGLEVVFQNQQGGLDLHHALRASTADPFGPTTVLAEVSSTSDDADADLSDDGTTLWFASERQGGLGSWDLWFATRSCQ